MKKPNDERESSCWYRPGSPSGGVRDDGGGCLFPEAGDAGCLYGFSQATEGSVPGSALSLQVALREGHPRRAFSETVGHRDVLERASCSGHRYCLP